MITWDSNSITIGDFLSSHKASSVLHNAKQVIEVYGYISLADMLDLCGKNPSYKDSKVGWTADAMENSEIKKIADNAYVITMPEYNWHADDDEPVSLDEKSQSEPIDITVPSDKLEQTISTLFKDPEKIKDRPVFITIM